MEDSTVDRRTMLRVLTTTGIAAGLAGCSSGGSSSNDGDDSTPTGTPAGTASGTPTPRPGVIEDTFEDGSISYDQKWEISSCDCSASAEVVDRESPDGGSKAFRLVDGKDPDHGLEKGLRAELVEMAEFGGDPWTIEGQFYLESYPDTGRDPVETFISVSHVDFIPGGRDSGEENAMHLNHDGPSMGKEERVTAPALQEDTWYEYTIRHDGDGGYTATRHELDDGERVDSAEISLQSKSPMESASLEFYVIGGNGTRDEGGNPIAVEHSYVRWTDDS